MVGQSCPQLSAKQNKHRWVKRAYLVFLFDHHFPKPELFLIKSFLLLLFGGLDLRLTHLDAHLGLLILNIFVPIGDILFALFAIITKNLN